jgi:ribonucleoside-diphosphate reductase beta chain
MSGVPPKYGSKNPFSFMNQLNFDNRTNFFERRPSEYSKPKNADDDWDAAVTY